MTTTTNDPSTTSHVAPYVHKAENIQDEVTGNAFQRYVFSHRYGYQHQIDVPLEKDTEKTVKDALLKQNASLGPHITSLISAAVKSPPTGNILIAAHVGWRDDYAAFVTRYRIIGNPRVGAAQLQPPSCEQIGTLSNGMGKLSEWQKTVGRLGRHSSRLTLALCASFAAPLVRISGLPSFGFSIFGAAKSGKTSAALAAGSVIGFAAEKHLPHFHGTKVSYNEIALAFNDLPTIMNETGTLSKSEGNVYDQLRDLLFNFAEGHDKRRSQKSEYATPTQRSMWHGILFTTSEQSIDEFAAEAKRQRIEGEYARFIDVPALREGREKLLDMPPAGLSEKEYLAWADQTFLDLRKACAANNGRAIIPYIKHLMKTSGTLEERVSRLIARFERSVHAINLDGHLHHAARSFGLLYAGGCIASEVGILPLRRKHILKSVRICFEDAVGLLQKKKAAASPRRQLLRFLRETRLKKRHGGSSFGPKDTAGFSEQKGSQRLLTIHSKKFGNAFATSADCQKCLMWLKKLGYLQLSRKAKPAQGGTEWAQQFPRWPNGKQVRSIIVLDPRKSVRAKTGKAK